jgi:hypothetical protein
MMRPLSTRELLKVWEVGEYQHPLDRALILLATACPEQPWDELAALSIGKRDALLLALREQTLGPKINGFAECPRCAQRLEFDTTADNLTVADADPKVEVRELVAGGLELRFRLPDSRDLAAVLDSQDADAARNLLVRRCVLQASRDGTPFASSELPPDIIVKLAQRMAECDPQAEVLLDLRCPTCGHGWQALFDIVAFFWAELAARAERLLGEVHTLARAYGWAEADILNMGARRRRFYLEIAT